jgi:hypothetical protein
MNIVGYLIDGLMSIIIFELIGVLVYNLLRYIYARRESKHPEMGRYNKDPWGEPHEIAARAVERTHHVQGVPPF